MIKIPSCTLVMVETRQVNLAIKTLQYMMDRVKFDDVILFTSEHDSFDYYGDGINKMGIQINDVDDYNRFMICELPTYITTNRILCTQCDGFITNPDGWMDEFLEYDYIGAPWWYHPYNSMPGQAISTPSTCVGNGGFSLRSLKMCKVAKAVTEKYNINNIHPEDVYVCRTLRPYMNEAGVKFAPEWLAHKFSCEDRVYANQFGFHGHNTYDMNPLLPRVVENCDHCKGRPESDHGSYCKECGRRIGGGWRQISDRETRVTN